MGHPCVALRRVVCAPRPLAGALDGDGAQCPGVNEADGPVNFIKEGLLASGMKRSERASGVWKQRLSQIAIGLFLVALMILSIVQFANNNATNSGGLTFNKHDFTQVRDGLSVTAGGKQLTVQDFPVAQNASTLTFQSVYGLIIPVEAQPGISTILKNATYIVTTFDPTADAQRLQFVDMARFDLSQQLPNTYSGQLENSTAYPGVPVATCADAVNGAVVIRLIVTNQTSSNATIAAAGDCITATGDPYGLVAAKDYLILSYYGVIPDGG